MNARTSICVSYKHVEGWHIFTSDEIRGLYVASSDAELAYNDVALSIEKLLKLDEGMVCKVEPELTFAEFVNAVRHSREQKKEEVSQPMRLSSHRYSVYACA